MVLILDGRVRLHRRSKWAEKLAAAVDDGGLGIAATLVSAAAMGGIAAAFVELPWSLHAVVGTAVRRVPMAASALGIATALAGLVAVVLDAVASGAESAAVVLDAAASVVENAAALEQPAAATHNLAPSQVQSPRTAAAAAHTLASALRLAPRPAASAIPL